MDVLIRKVQPGDENSLAYIQTESWKAAFRGILDDETLARVTKLDRATAMYRRLLEEGKGNGYLLLLDGAPHCLAFWDAARDEALSGKAEIIAIHSLPGNWRRGYGGQMMDRVLSDIAAAGYAEAALWVFEKNTRARAFYEARGFRASGLTKEGLGAVEMCYVRGLCQSDC